MIPQAHQIGYVWKTPFHKSGHIYRASSKYSNRTAIFNFEVLDKRRPDNQGSTAPLLLFCITTFKVPRVSSRLNHKLAAYCLRPLTRACKLQWKHSSLVSQQEYRSHQKSWETFNFPSSYVITGIMETNIAG